MCTLISVAQELEQVITNLIRGTFGGQVYDKVCACLAAYRKACLLRNNPNLYNDFAREFKHLLSKSKKEQLWLDVVEKNLGLVSRDEHRDSRVEEEEAKKFFGTLSTMNMYLRLRVNECNTCVISGTF